MRINLANRKDVLWLYSANLTADGWRLVDSDNTAKGYYQTVACMVHDDGEEITENTQLAMPMALSTGDWDKDDSLRYILSVINEGITESGNGVVTVKIRQSINTDVTIYWYGR